jgi:outer membrane phospholipase A
MEGDFEVMFLDLSGDTRKYRNRLRVATSEPRVKRDDLKMIHPRCVLFKYYEDESNENRKSAIKFQLSCKLATVIFMV